MPVIDANVALAWTFPGVRTAAAIEVIEQSDRLIAPDLIVHELTNAAWTIAGQKLTDPAIAQANLESALGSLDALYAGAPLSQRAFQIACDLNHPAYDCFYLALAEREAEELVTADMRLIRALVGSAYEGLARPL